MVMPQMERVWTRDEVLALPEDGKRYELIDGELLVSPAPTWPHQWAVSALHSRLKAYVREHRIGVAMFSPADLDLKSGQVSQPDVFVVSIRSDGRIPQAWDECDVPILIAEVLSPSTARYDRITKRVRYQRSGVGEYWIVDTDAQAIERWTPTDTRPEILDERISWHPSGASAPLVIELAEYFSDARAGG